MGTGGSPEGVLAAAALRCLGGKNYTKLIQIEFIKTTYDRIVLIKFC